MTKIELLKEYDKEYYNGDMTTLSDTEYDLLKDEARNENPDDPYFDTVGAEILSNEEKVELPCILGSLDKVKSDTVEKWVRGLGSVVISHKLDGVSFMVIYENGNVAFGATRGNGKEGQNITSKLQQLLPKIKVNGSVSLRGELLLYNDDHTKLGYKNRRNGVNGALAHHVDYLHPVFYEAIDYPGIDNTYEDERLVFISNNLGLNTVDFVVLNDEDVTAEELTTILMNDKQEVPYDMDGLVLTKNWSARENVMLPTNKVAFKVNTDAIRVKVTGVEWNLGRTGKVTPIVHIEPTELDGVTISKATGFNYEFVATNGIGPGSVIGLVRSGGVIPYITEVFEPTVVDIPDRCPSCNGKLTLIGVDLVCGAGDCYDAKVRQIAHFFKTMGADFFTETTIRNLGISSIEDAYNLDELEIANIEGFGIKKAEQVYYEIQKTLTTTPDKLLAAFGISGIGKTLAPVILAKYTFDELFSVKSIDNIDGVGGILSDNLVNNINNYVSLVNFMREKGLKFKVNESKEGIAGKVFTLTGTLPMKRDVITQMIVSKGGSVKGISKTTDYLITDDPNSGSAKNKKAQSYGTKIIDFAGFMELIEG